MHAGDAFFVPSGTAHTIGPGMVLCEIQQHSDITYRVFDYNRLQADGKPRPLHFRQALEVMRFGESRAAEKSRPCKFSAARCSKPIWPPAATSPPSAGNSPSAWRRATSPERFELLIPISGRGRIEWDAESASYGPAEVWMLPAALGAYQLAPESPTSLLRTYVPDLRRIRARTRRPRTRRSRPLARGASMIHMQVHEEPASRKPTPSFLPEDAARASGRAAAPARPSSY